MPEADGAERTRPIGLFLFGEAFFLSARHLREALNAKTLKLRFEMPVYYFYSHALELVLKALLVLSALAPEARSNAA